MDDIIRQAGVTTGQQGALYQPYGQLGQESLNRLNAFEEAAARGDYSALPDRLNISLHNNRGSLT
jgi:hypothetical protein